MQVAATTMNDSDRSDGAGTEFAVRDNAWPLANLLWRIYAEVRPVSTSPGGLPFPSTRSPRVRLIVTSQNIPDWAVLRESFIRRLPSYRRPSPRSSRMKRNASPRADIMSARRMSVRATTGGDGWAWCCWICGGRSTGWIKPGASVRRGHGSNGGGSHCVSTEKGL